MALPTEKSKRKRNLLDYVILLHGFPKIGKSTLANQAGKVLFADTEGGLSALEVFKSPITSWNSDENGFLQVCKDFTTTEHDFTAMCIDTIDILHKLCSNYVMRKQNIIHPSDLDWGKGWALVKNEFMRPLVKLAVSPYGIILISHTREIEITIRTRSLTKAVPTLQNYIWNMIEAFVDIILYFHSEATEEGEKRYIRTKPSEKWIAGDRTNRLLKADPIEIFPEMNNWEKLEDVFKNEEKKNNLLLGGK